MQPKTKRSDINHTVSYNYLNDEEAHKTKN